MTGIYYGDLFVINGKGCVVMGHGKSKTCRNYTGETTREVMTDSLRFDVEGNSLVAYGDAGMGFFPFDPQRCPRMLVDYFIYMQAEEETDFNTIQEVSNNEFCEIADFNITFGISDVEKRQAEFKDLLVGKNVFCKHFLAKVAKYFWRMLHLQIGESCKASTGSCPASCIAIADQI